MTVRFGILGPVCIWRGGTPALTGGPQQRLVLGLLLARAGAVVSQTELVDAVWGAGPPPSAANVLHRSIGLLRRTMEPDLPIRATGSLLDRIGTGYRLRAETFDLLEFRDLVARARQQSDEHAALAGYVRALNLWRGVCAAGLAPGGRLCPAFTSIDGERSQAARDAVDLALRIGAVSRVLPQAHAAALAHPLDEALQSRFVLALAADGQRRRALLAYRAVRDRLADDLGMDPGPELRAAHDTLSRAATGPQRAPRLGRPAQLPPVHPFFADRPAVIGRALRLIGEQRGTGPAVLTVAGMPGAGKTTLAVHLAHRLAADFPDGQLYADLCGYGRATAVRPAEALRGFLASLGDPPRRLPAGLDALAHRFRALLASRRVLLVLDNCGDLDQIRDLLPGTPGSTVIVTGRTDRSVTGPVLRLELPGADEARALLAQRLGPARIAAAPAAAERIVTACGHLPLALAVVAARAAAAPGTPLAAIAGEPTGDAELTGAFSGSYDRLTPAAARLFRLLPLHPGPDITIASIATLAGVTPPMARLLAGDLVSHGLLEPRAGRFALHRLLRAYARGLSTGPDAVGARWEKAPSVLQSSD